MRLVSWNVNGIRAIVKKNFLNDVKAMNADVLCLQETKAPVEEVKPIGDLMPGYSVYANSAKSRKGYSGTAIFTRQKPVKVINDINIDHHDQEGRVITAEFDDLILVTVYVPNSGEGLARLKYRATWDDDFREYLVGLQKKKPVAVCGDFNVAHREIDITRAKENYNKSAGYTEQEIAGFDKLLEAGFVDVFRVLHPDEIKYTYWNYLFNARARNVGWRIDYFLLSPALAGKVKKAEIFNEYLGSDHCPVAVEF